MKKRLIHFWDEEHSLTALLILLMVEMFIIIPIGQGRSCIGADRYFRILFPAPCGTAYDGPSQDFPGGFRGLCYQHDRSATGTFCLRRFRPSSVGCPAFNTVRCRHDNCSALAGLSRRPGDRPPCPRRSCRISSHCDSVRLQLYIHRILCPRSVSIAGMGLRPGLSVERHSSISAWLH